MIKTIFTIIICHSLGDYWLQSDFIAKTKGENWYHLFVHCVLYAVPFLIAFGWCWQLEYITFFRFVVDTLKARNKKITYLDDQALHYIIAASYLF